MLLHLDQSQSVLYKVYNISGSSLHAACCIPFASKKLSIEAPHRVYTTLSTVKI